MTINAYTRNLLRVVLATLALIALPAHAQDQETPAPRVADDAAVWSVIERAWRSERENDSDWVNELLSADFVGWSHDSPAPRDKSSTRQWTQYNSKQDKLLEYELYPLSIVVHGDTAIAHYLFASVMQIRGESPRQLTGRYTDVLVRTANGWRFLAWHGGPDHQ